MGTTREGRDQDTVHAFTKWCVDANTQTKTMKEWQNRQYRINNLRYTDDTIFMAESKEELKSLLMKVKEESEKSWPKTQHSEN